jgi:hypothetical protein
MIYLKKLFNLQKFTYKNSFFLKNEKYFCFISGHFQVPLLLCILFQILTHLKKTKKEFRDLPTHVKHLLVVFGKLTFC